MMLFWVLAATLTALVVAIMVRPLLGGGTAVEGDPLAIYRDQLAELERDKAAGAVDPAEADGLRAEIARRLLAAERARGTTQPGITRLGGAKLAGFGVLALTPILAVLAYLTVSDSAPGLPSLPFAERDPAERAIIQERLAALDALQEHLTVNPADFESWLRLAQIAIQSEQFETAQEAYARAIGLVPDDDELRAPLVSAWAEMLVVVNRNIVSGQARTAFQEVLLVTPNEPRARHYLALERRQAGDLDAAWDQWLEIVAISPADAPWLALIMPELEALASETGRDLAQALPPPASGPNAAEIAAAEAMSTEDRQAMIEGMVEGLAARLAEDPEDRDGWLQLAQAYEVQERPLDAYTALMEAAARTPEPEEELLILNRAGNALMASAADGDLPDALPSLAARILTLDPNNPQALWYSGLVAYLNGNVDMATNAWGHLYTLLPEESPQRTAFEQELTALGVDLSLGSDVD